MTFAAGADWALTNQDIARAPDGRLAPGTRVAVRDEEWLVRSVGPTQHDGLRVEVAGISELVRDTDAVFFTGLDTIEPIDPARTRLVPDDTPGFRRSRLWLEALLRRTPLEATDARLAVGHRGLLDELVYQRRPAALALQNLRPRILVADAVGLGKTLEIGMLLAELIRRGRGERICVITPRAVLEQFQQELWIRFAIPLVRLDSDGIQQIRQEVPATRNPFTFYKRVIISIDTLKNPARYRHHLQGHRWDVVVIDECHNVVNPGTQNFRLAELLASRTDALILASATPHNGKPESFASLINLLDPTAIADPADYDSGDIKHLYVRRHRGSTDVTHEVAHNWAERAEPEVIPVTPGPAEEAVLDELQHTWLHPLSGSAPVAGRGAQLVPWTLFKACLSSPGALRQTIRQRQRSAEASELAALDVLDSLVAKAAAAEPAKLEALTTLLRKIGVGPGSPTRAVVFSERIATLDWVHSELPGRLGIRPEAVTVLHGSMPDTEQLSRVEQFGQAESPLRVLLAGDMASEGLNLQRQCHHLIHFDLPWSLIRLQQRNGRIDRYTQIHPPRIYALALTPADADLASDVTVITRLVAKENAAHRALGDAGALLALHDEDAEEAVIRRAIQERRDIDDVVPDPAPDNLSPFERLMSLGGAHAAEPAAPIAPVRGLFGSETDFLTEALNEITGGAAEHDLRLVTEPANGLIALNPPADLARRFAALPQTYLSERKVTQRLVVTGLAAFADERLARARESDSTSWPDALYLAPLHPVLDWAADRALARYARDEAPVLAAQVDTPVFCVQGMWSNERGQPVLVHWGAISGLPDAPRVEDLMTLLDRAGIRSGTVNPGFDAERLADWQSLVGRAADAEREHLLRLAALRAEALQPRITEFTQRLERWAGAREQRLVERGPVDARRRKEEERIAAIRDETHNLISSLSPAGKPLIRVLAVIVPEAS
jgi:superfamily II DNA or RNA helicase